MKAVDNYLDGASARDEKTFSPPWYLKGPLIQTLLNSARFRNRGTGALERCAVETIIDAGNGIRLQGFLSRQPDRVPKGLVVLLHGWEGSADSAYIVCTGRYFHDCGFDVLRLNLRDHGDSHHLNEGFFLGTMIDETYSAIKEIVRRFAGKGSACLAGFSMGANFCIRIAAMASDEAFSGLSHVFAVNPPLDPFDSTRRVDRSWLFRKYFMEKWKGSLAKKQALFPETYDFSDVVSLNGCIPMTERLLRKYTDYASLEDYYGRYTLKTGYLDRIGIPFTLLMSADDPIIPYKDIASARMSPDVNFILQKWGGHCGYLMNRRFEPWYLSHMRQAFDGKKA